MKEHALDIIFYVLSGLGTLIAAVGGYIIKWKRGVDGRFNGMDKRITNVDADMERKFLKIATIYVTKTEHDKVLDRIDSKLEKILDKLDTKADK